MARGVVMIEYNEVLALEPPHGFLMAQEKKIAIARIEPLDTSKSYLIVSNGEAFGVAEFDQPAQVKTKDFDADEWLNQHRVTQRERRQWWPDKEAFYVYRLKAWQPFESVKLFKNGQLLNEPRLTKEQWEIVSKAKELPKQIIIEEDFISLNCNHTAYCGDKGFYNREVKAVVDATFNERIDVNTPSPEDDIIPIYSLALVRNPRMRVSKKNLSPEVAEKKIKVEVEIEETDQEGEQMPYEIRRRDGEYCVVKINPDDSETTEKCHPTMEMAQAHLDALNINVVAEEEMAYGQEAKDTKKEKAVILADFSSNDVTTIPGIDKIITTGAKQFDETAWDGAASNWPDTAAYCSDCLIDVNPAGEDKIQAFCKLPYRKPGSSEPNKAALRAIAGGRGISALEKPADTPENTWNSQVRGAANKLIGWWPDAFEQDAPEAIYQAAGKTRPKGEPNFLQRLKLAAKNLLDIVTLAEKEEIKEERDILTSNYGVTQKEVNGELWHFTWSTNAFEDREREIFSTRALENYVLQAEQKQDRGYFNLWHINAEDGNFNTDFARKEWQGVVGRILMEAGPYLNNEKGQAAKAFFSQYSDGHPEIAPEGWGCSPEFRYLPEERATGVYENIWITRTSTLPRMAAANIWTETRQLARSKNNMLTEDQTKAAVALFGKDYVDNLLKEGEKRTEELEAAGVAHKEKKEEAAPKPVEVELNMEELAAEVGKQFTANLDPIAEAIATMADSVKQLQDRLAKLESDSKIKAVTESPRYVFNMKRASEAETTVVTDDDELKGKKPVETTKANADDPWSQMFNR